MKKIPKKWQAPDWKKPLKQLSDVLEQFELSFVREQYRRELIREIDREIQKATLSAEKVYQLILNDGLDEVNADYGYIFKIEGEYLKLIAMKGKHSVVSEFPIKNSLSEQSLLNGQTINVGDVTKLPRNQYYRFHDDTMSELSIPIKDYRGVKNLGIFNIERKIKGEFDSDAIVFCELLKGQIAIAMEQVRIWEGVSLIHELSIELLSGETDLSKTYDLVLDRILKILDFKFGQILLLEDNQLKVVTSSRREDIGLSVDADNSLCGAYIIRDKGRVPLRIDDIKKSKYKKHYKWLLGKDYKTRMVSEFVIPLVRDKVIGVINIEDPRYNAFSEYDEHVLNILGNVITEAIEAAKHRKEIQFYQMARDCDLLLAQLGHVSFDFLHKFGGKIGNAKARVAEFKRSVSKTLLPNFGSRSGVEFLEGILHNLREADELIKDFKDKFDPTKAEVRSKNIDIVKVTNHAIKKICHVKPDTITIELTIDKRSFGERKTIECWLNERFGEILDSLLTNAIEAMPQGGKIHILIQAKDPLTCELSIADTGVGISEEIRSKIFDYGFTTKSGGRLSRGLGLWFVKLYIDRFNGNITFKSTVGKGSTFLLRFPISI